MGLGLRSGLPVVLGAAVAVKVGVGIHGFRSLLVALGGRSLRLFVGELLDGHSLETKCSLDGFLSVEWSWLALCTGMYKVLSNGLVPIVGVEAINMLPRVTRLTVDGVSIVVSEVTDTLDCVRLFFRCLGLWGTVFLGCWAQGYGRRNLTRSRGLCGQRRRVIGHSLHKTSRGSIRPRDA